jgi:hypothetical protein
MIDLPSYPPPAAAQPSFLDRGVTLEGAVDQRVDRMGSRFGLSVSMPPMKGSKLGRQWIAALMRGKNEGVRLRWPLQGFKPGQPFNHVPADGEELLYFVTEEAIANGSGEAELTIEPMLRVEPADDDDLEFGVPVICGFLASGDLPWDLGVAQQVGLGFAIKERR